MSTLRELLSKGEKNIGIFIWHENQRVPAEVYVRAHQAEIRQHGANVVIKVSRAKRIGKGWKYQGLRPIRYHFSGGSGVSSGK